MSSPARYIDRRTDPIDFHVAACEHRKGTRCAFPHTHTNIGIRDNSPRPREGLYGSQPQEYGYTVYTACWSRCTASRAIGNTSSGDGCLVQAGRSFDITGLFGRKVAQTTANGALGGEGSCSYVQGWHSPPAALPLCCGKIPTSAFPLSRRPTLNHPTPYPRPRRTGSLTNANVTRT